MTLPPRSRASARPIEFYVAKRDAQAPMLSMRCKVAIIAVTYDEKIFGRFDRIYQLQGWLDGRRSPKSRLMALPKVCSWHIATV
jgi:hypothetical protein